MARMESTERTESIRILPTEVYFSLVRRMLAETGQAYVRVTGTSMLPLLRPMRDGVVIRPAGKLRPGDIVLCDRGNGRYVLHRVIRMGRDGFTMAGDHQGHAEPGFSRDQVLGVVREIDRGNRRISVNSFFLVLYAGGMTATAFPRIYLWRATEPLRRLFRRGRTDSPGGAGR